MKMSARFDGGDALARKFQQLPSRVSKSVLREALRTVVAPPIQRAAAANAPRRAGAPDIAAHIVISTGRAEGEFAAAVVVGPSRETRADQPSRRFDQQGLYLEFGTNDTPMQASLRPAFDSEAVRTLGPLGHELWRSLAAEGVSTRTSPGGGGLL